MAIGSTIKTVFGFLATLITRYTPIDLSRKSLEGVFNYLPISESIITSGQPTDMQFELVKEAGFLKVINLAPHTAENALPDEAATLASLGMDYTHIPVDFQNPTEANFEEFCAAMEEIDPAPVLVHCAANMRVSAFMYRYRAEVLGENPRQLEVDLHKIWEPFGVWKVFVGKAEAPRKN